MRASALELFPRFYDQRQTESAAVHIAHLDPMLIEDRTYFVHEVGGEIVACGGWSRRNKRFAGEGAAADDDRLLDPETEPARVRAMFVRRDWTRRGLGRAILNSCQRAARADGFRKLILGATLPGVPLYRAFGFAPSRVLHPTPASLRPLRLWKPRISRIFATAKGARRVLLAAGFYRPRAARWL